MEFEKYLLKVRVSDWSPNYIDYVVLLRMLEVPQRLSAKVHFKKGQFFVSGLNESERKTLQQVNRLFFNAFHDQISKAKAFLDFQIERSLKPNLFFFMFNIQELLTVRKGAVADGDDCPELDQLKLGLERLYVHVLSLQSFFQANVKIYEKLVTIYRRELGAFNMINEEQLTAEDEHLRADKFMATAKHLDQYCRAIGNLYSERLHTEEEFKDAQDRLFKMHIHGSFSKEESFQFGFFLGSMILCLVLCCALLAEAKFFTESPSDFAKFGVPVFRGTLAIFMYLFFFGMNMYFWETFGVNYRKLLQIDTHNSSALQFMKRSFGFMAFWLICFCYCALSHSPFSEVSQIFSQRVAMSLATCPPCCSSSTSSSP